MRTSCVILGVVLALLVMQGPPLAAQRPPKDALEESVDRGLAFLALMQEKDGSWTHQGQKHLAISALATLSFLSAGHLPDEGPHGETVATAVRWILQQQQPSGVFSSEPGLEMYHHGIVTLLLSQLVGLSDREASATLRPKLEKATAVLLKAQVQNAGVYQGGWRYRVDSTDADLSVSGWPLLALRGVRNVGADVPVEVIQKALAFVERNRDSTQGGYSYTPGANASLACTGTAILVNELAGKNYHRSRDALLAGSYILKTPIQPTDNHFFYTTYYTTQAMFQLGDNYWNAYRPQAHKLLLPKQARSGAWIGDHYYTPINATAMAILALTVEYRLLPIYQRDEDKK